jgi:putative transposase
MKKTHLTEEHVVPISGRPMTGRSRIGPRNTGSAPRRFQGRRKHVGPLEPADVEGLRQLEQEKGRLKKMVADQELELDVLKEITRQAGRRTRSSRAGCICWNWRRVDARRLRDPLDCALVRRLSVATADAGCARCGSHAGARGPASGVGLPEDSDPPAPGRACDERRPHVPTLARKRATRVRAWRGPWHR